MGENGYIMQAREPKEYGKSRNTIVWLAQALVEIVGILLLTS